MEIAYLDLFASAGPEEFGDDGEVGAEDLQGTVEFLCFVREPLFGVFFLASAFATALDGAGLFWLGVFKVPRVHLQRVLDDLHFSVDAAQPRLRAWPRFGLAGGCLTLRRR